ncbi:hypothetical protein N7444_005807 [Penicillium canescens]|nr:hypothetical protein N7444_005807 [Penicillium canescens]
MGAMALFLQSKSMSAFGLTLQTLIATRLTFFVTFALVNTSFNIFTDVLFATIPIPIIWNLKMRRKVWLYLIGILSLDMCPFFPFEVIVQSQKSSYLTHYLEYSAVIFGVLTVIYQIAFQTTQDQYLDDWILFWATAQFNTRILAACIPSLKPLESTVLKRSEYSNSNSQTRGPYGRHSRRHAPTGTGGSIPTTWRGSGNHMWSVHRGDQYMLQDLGSRDSSDHFPEGCPNGEYIVTAAYAEERSATVATQPPGQEHQTKNENIRTTEVIVN